MAELSSSVERQDGAKSVDFTERVVLVTGAGRGLGRAYALELARRGARVVVNNRVRAGSDPASAVVAEIEAAGGQAIVEPSDVASPEGGDKVVRAALEAFGRLDAVILNAGGPRDRTLAKTTDAEWDEVLASNLSGAFHVARPAFRAMKAAGYGRMVFVTSSAGLFGNFGQANYAAAKMGVVGLSSVVAIEGKRYGIHSNVVAPLARTGPAAEALGEVARELDPEAVAPLVLFLASDACAVSREVYSAGGGHFARVAVQRAPGWTAGERLTDPEAVLAHLDQIRDMTGGAEPLDFPEELELVARSLRER